MKSVSWLLLMLALLCSGQVTEQWFGTGPPQLLTSAEAMIPLMTWSDYAALAKNLTGPR
jgi:hypothetical protein